MTETVSHVAFQQLSPTYSPHFSWLPGVAHQVGEHGCVSINSDATSQQWIQTNDIIEQIDDLHFSLLGRVDRVINSAGRKIQAEKVEKELGYLFPDRSFFVGSLPDDSFGEKAVLFMEGSTVIDEQSLRVPSLESWEIPKDVIYLSKFETTGSGKMDRLKSVALYLNAQK
jgi:O-succinylbenzoic acid--CoA ligase